MAWTTAVRNLTSEATTEGWAALAISIILGVDTDMAFEMLTKPSKRGVKNKNKYTEQDIADMRKYREQGLTWTEIGEIFNISTSCACRMYYYKQGKSE